ncbi:hypothetical protein HMPREF1199_00958 [Hoylesella oralis CC98A]|nr:hypothetical protein HMPREF1199_00958 [Hoylesella oralis CC98A]
MRDERIRMKDERLLVEFITKNNEQSFILILSSLISYPYNKGDNKRVSDSHRRCRNERRAMSVGLSIRLHSS